MQNTAQTSVGRVLIFQEWHVQLSKKESATFSQVMNIKVVSLF
jgi:hypothetical protein